MIVGDDAVINAQKPAVRGIVVAQRMVWGGEKRGDGAMRKRRPGGRNANA
jgi:hypothetical protein